MNGIDSTEIKQDISNIRLLFDGIEYNINNK